VKSWHTNRLGERLEVLFVKASGWDMATIEPQGHCGLELNYLRKLRRLAELSDEEMMEELRTQLLQADAPSPSIEALAHAFIPHKFVDHTHADAILALTNQPHGEELIAEALGPDVVLVEYVKPGFKLAQAAARAIEGAPGSRAMVWMRHGLLTWGETARDSYEHTIDLVSQAEEYLVRKARRSLTIQVPTALETAKERLVRVAPIVRGALAPATGDPDRPRQPMILLSLINREVLDFVDSQQGKALALTPPLTSDHLIRTKPFPMWVDAPNYDDIKTLREQISQAVQAYATAYEGYLARHSARMPAGVSRFDSLPRVVLMPGLGAFCAGRDFSAAQIVRDITAHTLAVKVQVGAMGSYEGLSESDLFDMEYHSLQHAKLRKGEGQALTGHVALVTGAAGAIGSATSPSLTYRARICKVWARN